MKAALTLILALVAAQMLATVPDLSIANKIGYAYPGTATIDGIISEGEWDAATAHDGNVINEYIPNGTNFTPPTDDADLSGIWYALWDEEALYLYVEANDDVLVFGDASFPDSDAIEVFISTAYSRFFGEWQNVGYDLISDFHSKFGLLSADMIGAFHGQSSFDYDSIISETNIPRAFVPTHNGYRVEIKLPWSYVMGDTALSGVTFSNGVFSGGKNSEKYGSERSFLGFDVHLQDNDQDDGRRDTKVAWNSGYEGRRGDFHWNDTQVWGTLVLVPIDTWNMKEAVFSAKPWIDMGNDFVFNLVEEHFYYIGVNRYAYDFADESWWYIHEDGAKPDGFFIYDFSQGQWFYINEGLKVALD